MKNFKDTIPKFKALCDLREKVLEQYSLIEERSKLKDTFMFDLYLTVDDSDLRLKELIGSLGKDAPDFFKCSRLQLLNPKEKPNYDYAAMSSFKFKGDLLDAPAEVPISIFKSRMHKCIRCFKYLANQENSICPICIPYLPKNSDIARTAKSF